MCVCTYIYMYTHTYICIYIYFTCTHTTCNTHTHTHSYHIHYIHIHITHITHIHNLQYRRTTNKRNSVISHTYIHTYSYHIHIHFTYSYHIQCPRTSVTKSYPTHTPLHNRIMHIAYIFTSHPLHIYIHNLQNRRFTNKCNEDHTYIVSFIGLFGKRDL